MLGMMMDQPLLISNLIEHAARFHGDTEIVSREADAAFVVAQSARNAVHQRAFARAVGTDQT